MEITTEIEIGASAEAVWEVLTDFASYPEWNPMISDISGRPEVGCKVQFHVALGTISLPLDAEVVCADSGRELRWVGPARGPLRRLMSGSHYYRLEETDAGTVVLSHGEHFGGLLIPRSWRRGQRKLTPMYEAFNRALKRRVEDASSDSTNKG